MKKVVEETNENKKNKGKHKIWLEMLDYLKTIGIVVVVVLLLNHFVVINAKIPSESMENTILKGDQLFGNRLAYLFSDPERFDIVIFRYPDDPETLYIKRIIGLPGEKVHIIDGKVYIDDSRIPLDDSFCPEEPYAEDFGPYIVPDGCYFMLGDNRNCSKDSRYWNNKFVEEDDILGKAFLRYWPLNKIGLVN